MELKKEARILIVDDDEDILLSMKMLLKQHFTEVITEKKAFQIPYLLDKFSFDIILLDMNFSAGLNTGNEGIYWLKQILDKEPSAVVIMITAYGDVELAVKAIKEGATDFVLKPWNNEKLLTTLSASLQLKLSKNEIIKLRQKQKHLKEDINRTFPEFIGKSPAMLQVFKTIAKVAKTDANVLITGENGTGKELVARELHKQSLRNDEIFVSVDMSAITETLFESELFGAMKGSYTDSHEDRAGRFEVASGGTLFLDEIGNLSIPLQAKILTALQNRCITRLGANKPIPIDIRLISATNKNLFELSSSGHFREDLLYRINTIQIELPPLRERGEDICLLANHYLEIYSSKYKRNIQFHPSTCEKLMKYHWPGNVRELQHAVEKAIILADANLLMPNDFLFQSPKKANVTDSANLNIEEHEKQLIIKALEKNHGNMTAVAKELGITRATLYNKIEKYGI